MKRFRFPIAVAVTSLVLAVALVAAGGLLAGNVLANHFRYGGPGGPWSGGHGFGPGVSLPSELTGLRNLPPGERFAHFLGVQVNLTDRENKPLMVTATPGTATAVSATSLTIAANDGSTKTYSLDDKTIIHRKSAQNGAKESRPNLVQDDKVVVVTLNNSTTATAVLVVSPEGFGPRGPFGSGR
jgi:hypothetical protein